MSLKNARKIVQKMMKEKGLSSEEVRESFDEIINEKYKTLDLDKLRTKKSTIVSTEEALKDIVPINWSKDVLSGEKKVLINYGN